jgi:hypothetical protein
MNVNSNTTVRHDWWHLWRRLLAKLRSAIHHRRLRLQFYLFDPHDVQWAPYAVLRNGSHVPLSRKSTRRSRAWRTWDGRKEIPSSAIRRITCPQEYGT